MKDILGFTTSKTGNDVIADAIGSFTKVQEDLTKGIELCKSDNEKILLKISKLEEEEGKNIKSATKAQLFFDNIQKLLGE